MPMPIPAPIFILGLGEVLSCGSVVGIGLCWPYGAGVDSEASLDRPVSKIVEGFIVGLVFTVHLREADVELSVFKVVSGKKALPVS